MDKKEHAMSTEEVSLAVRREGRILAWLDLTGCVAL